MGLMPFINPSAPPAPSAERNWLTLVRAQVEGALAGLLELPDEVRLDTQWAEALARVRGVVLRPAERPRSALLLAGYCLVRGSPVVPAGLWRFAAGLELLHASQAIHDEVLRQGDARRPAGLCARLAPERTGEHLAVVVGDHLFARALETMLEAGVPGASEAGEHCLRLHRFTSAGLFRAEQGGGLLEPGGVGRAMRLVRLRAVREGLASSLVCGALLAGADTDTRLRLARVGLGVGLTVELRREWAGLGEGPEAGGGVGFLQGRCGFPLVAAWCRARPEVREELWALAHLAPEAREGASLARVRGLVEDAGGFAATESLMARSTFMALRALTSLPNPQGVRDLLQALIGPMAHQSVRGEAP
ncbi:polyprenyl synthetase family protein [Melittangium boletus]|uniref:polyprenyl synthetase family protein n=1 Tax=Melittangium boletus TaxID=83453 RepID=UPI003DA25013